MLKSKIVSSPAGSGKTQQLAERYIELLQQKVPPERILTITFTDKAAAEMKARIFKLLQERDVEMYRTLKEKSLSLRIQTIDSFCLSLLKRFAVHIGLQPDLEVIPDPDSIWTNSIYDTLMNIAEQEKKTNDYDLLMDVIVEDKFRGWINVKRLFDNLFANRLSIERGKTPSKNLYEIKELVEKINHNPLTQELIPNYKIRLPEDLAETEPIKSELLLIKETFLTKGNDKRSDKRNPTLDSWYDLMFDYWRVIQTVSSNNRFEKIFDLFKRRFLAEYDRRKKITRQVDFSDLELLTYKILTEHPQWSNILYVFDEHTDHILVDEFQDTSFLQWAIITKLAEEWLSGLGAKRERGIKPTMFLVGDDKQSIYLFRNAHSEIFEKAKEHLKSHLKNTELEIKEVTDNYRCLSSIIDFTNTVFPKIMKIETDAPAWVTHYKPFQRKRENTNPGIVEIILKAFEGKMPEFRDQDAELVALKILNIIDKPIVFDTDENPRPCRFEDITILLRSRTHLIRYENALRKHNIPFVIVKGIGFYDTPEIAILHSLLNFLSDTTQDFDLYVILKSPLFRLSEKEILMVSQGIRTENKISLWDRLQEYSKNHTRHLEMIERINSWVSDIGYRPMAEILENILETQEAWKSFWEPQRTVNIRKFLRIVEDLENDGAHPLAICDYFDKSGNKEESKANVNTEGRNEVKLMTIHAAKGLQFPVVFFVGLDESFEKRGKKSAKLLISEVDENNVWVSYEPDNNLRKLSPLFIEHQLKELEEEKRIFYVGVTRARDALFLTGIYNPRSIEKEGRLCWLIDALDIKQTKDGKFSFSNNNIPGLSIISDQEMQSVVGAKSQQFVDEERPKTLRLEPVIEEPEYEWRVVTKETFEVDDWVRRSYGEDWITLGDVLHKIFEKVSKGQLKLNLNDVLSEAKRLFNIKNIVVSTQAKLIDEIRKQYETIQGSKVSDIILPQENSYAETPFILKENKIIHSGRIDRVIINDDMINIYDYKTFPVEEKDIPDLEGKYKTQLSIYTKAVSEIFTNFRAESFLVFTAIGKIYEVT